MHQDKEADLVKVPKLLKEAEMHDKSFEFTAENFHKTIHTYRTILES